MGLRANSASANAASRCQGVRVLPRSCGEWSVHVPTRAVLAALVVAVVAMPALAAPDPLDRVREAVRAGQDGHALGLLLALPPEIRRENRLRYLRARLAERLGSPRDALEAFGRVDREALPEPVASDMEERRARLEVRAGACEQARPRLAVLLAHRGPSHAALEALAAECAARSGGFEEAERALREVVKRDGPGVDAFAAWLALAEVLWRRGRHAEAAAELRALVVARPEHPDAGAAEEQLRGMDPEVRFTHEERLARAGRFLSLHQEGRALRELEHLEPPADRDARAKWLHLRGMALFHTRHDYEEAARVLREAARLGGDTAVDDAFHAARALGRAGQAAEAMAAYRQLVSSHPTHPRAAQAEYYAALLDMGRAEARGARGLVRFLSGPRARLAAAEMRDARWHLALHAFRRGQHRDAAKAFREYALGGSEPLVAGRGHYWSGRALEAAGDRQGATAAYRAAMAVQAHHWYAWWADAQLRRLGEGAPASMALTRGEPSVAPSPATAARLPPAAAWLADLGLTADASRALSAEEAEIREEAGPRGLVEAYRRIGDETRASRLAASTMAAELRGLPQPDARWVWEAAYPRPWRETVVAEAEAHGVPEALVYAVMRQESGYDPEAVSYAGAIGLMQLMPRTAQGLSPLAQPDRLFDPRFNIALGAQLLGRLVREFDGSLPLAVAAYNAGSPRVRAWRAARPNADMDELVERIPIDQTRNYVRRVLSHYGRYRWLEGDAQASLLALP
jgi:soluble lytic murein transglycosylase